ncbi:Six-hairpin glycosidase [Mycena alexandri]|uniref:Six-hairpin glycosidase n=1 Tax=Mycena alexandri TaxID=1745969 RepID=A0AAD6XBZ3_9AGAR|nr:Six-hairpin glycosidase [Mycena alexandri]
MYAPLRCAAVAAALLSVRGQALSSADISTVQNNLATGAMQSWELGTRAQSLLELNVPNFSVFSSTGLPPPTSVPSNTTSAIAPVFSIAHNVVSALKNTSGPGGLVAADGAAGDPASIGVAVLLANWTGQGAADGLNYAAAAQNQLEYLLNVVPHTGDGAISHRVAQVQLWSDSVYMVPPFLAYYGVLTGNTTLLNEAYNQIKLYRNYLRDTSAQNLWKHIVLGNNSADGPNDEGHWSTGNGWAAAGMLRVIATMKNSPHNKDFSSQQKDLASWVKEIHTAMYAHIDKTNIFTNYADQSVNSTGQFYDTASTTLLASTVYRASLLLGDHSHLPNAEKCRKALFATSNNSSSTATHARRAAAAASSGSSAKASGSAPASGGATSGSATATSPSSASASPSPSAAPLTDLVHFTSDGWLTPVVNPHQFGVQGSDSPEGEAFVVSLQAAYNEWVAGGSVGANAGRRTASSAAGWAWVVGCTVLGSILAYA